MKHLIIELTENYIEMAKSNQIEEAEEMVANFMDEHGFGPSDADYINDALEAAGV